MKFSATFWFWAATLMVFANSFTISRTSLRLGNHGTLLTFGIRTHTRLRYSSEDGEDAEDKGELPSKGDDANKILQLPACGESEASKSGTMDANSLGENGESSPIFVGSKKFKMMWTCNICESRNTHMVNRIAYNKGVVVVTCKGCDSQHMIADNLGWSNHPGGFEGADTIEDFLEKKGQGDSVTRVSQEVWDLEHLMEESSTLCSLPEEEIYDEEGDLPDDNGIFD